MLGRTLQTVREQRGLTQAEAANRLGVSQAYVALLEKGHRRVPPRLARKAVRVFKLSPVLLPLTNVPSNVRADKLARDLSRLGYPGFAYLKGGWLKNPGEVLLTALSQPHLDSRLVEALPWVLLNYSDLDTSWVVSQTRLLNRTNRLGFIVDLAKGVLEMKGEIDSKRYRALSHLSESLRVSRLENEDTFFQQSLSETERDWLRTNRPREAEFWHLLTDWSPEFLQYAV